LNLAPRALSSWNMADFGVMFQTRFGGFRRKLFFLTARSRRFTGKSLDWAWLLGKSLVVFLSCLLAKRGHRPSSLRPKTLRRTQSRPSVSDLLFESSNLTTNRYIQRL
jgi:hypothetical protein